MRRFWPVICVISILAGSLFLVLSTRGFEPPPPGLLTRPDRESNARLSEQDKNLQPLAFQPLTLGRIRPTGWLRAQLRIQANGLSGHLDEFWPDIKDSAWLGGKAEGWERAPYWLDGIVPLAYLLDDDALKAKAQHFIDYVLDHQHQDGWLGPVSDGKHPPYDPWPIYVVFKALTQYQEATEDPRVIPAMLRCSLKLDAVITQKPLGSWAHFRSADLVLSLYWLHDRTNEPWLIDLAAKVQKQGFDWRGLYENFPYKTRTERKFELDSHGVNSGMGLKQPGVRARLSDDRGDRDAVFHMIELLDRFHGQATGIFTCDEHLAGKNPSQGTELCTVVETMFSLETLVSILGEPALADRLECIAFNALPATFKPDMCAHQYDQQANQVVCKSASEHIYVNNGPDSNLFGLEPNFGCCTANMHQGWPKLTSHLWMSSPDGGLAAVAYAPCTIQTQVNGKNVRIDVETDYPFRDTVKITVQAEDDIRFPIRLRIPAWSDAAEVAVGQGRPTPARAGQFHLIDRAWKGTSEITLRLPMKVRLWQGYHDSVAIERGPLVYALRIGESWKRLKGEPPFADWEVYPTTPWNYALRLDRAHPETSVQFEARSVGDHPFSPEGAPVVAKVNGRAIPSWNLEKNAAAPPPQSPVRSSQSLQELELVPYGCTSLRVTEFPMLTD